MINSHRILSEKVQGKTVYRVDLNKNHKPDADEPMVMRRDGDGWKPAENVDRPVSRFNMESQFGFWTDKQVSHKEGWFWDRQEVIDRPKNGTVEPDEISTNGFRRLGTGVDGRSNTFELGGEIVKDSDGALFLDEHFTTFGSHFIVGEGTIKSLEEYRNDDKNWQVSRQEPLLIGVAEGPFSIGSGSTTITVPITMGKPSK